MTDTLKVSVTMFNPKPMKIILLILCLSFSICTFACSCYEIPSVEDAYFVTRVVVSGKVISLDYVSVWSTMAPEKRTQAKESFLKIHPNTASLETPIIQKVTLEVSNKYKGENLKDTIVIYTHRSSAACGFTWFKVGEEFIIYATPYYSYSLFNPNKINGLELKNTYWTNHCTRTKPYYEKEAEELAILSQK